ncbi:hypothetical protein PV783_20115 [Chitinophaga sp. CC14]|uniref:hypothetical protein n=1 Tax=Chitinophaga TaxID=79328 RepID=UPI000DB9E97D|nr:hypothetical protein [Chitinophaga ginsengisegetis]MDR6570063.1 hypothetical protein [Chitinophaga ginsengisegetis]MDR6649797.1 hypothetical protein [Chitinophaga ginsengisegetis]MDR6656000.1 hypothetical protein [Chitinophaga ginsengisegetis]
MSKSVNAVLAGFMNLSPNEKEEVRKFLKEEQSMWENDRFQKREKLNEETKRVTGPSASSTCPCCQR